MRFININHLFKALIASTLLVLASGSSAALITGDITFSGDWDSDDSVQHTTSITFLNDDVDADGANGDFSAIAESDIGSISTLSFGVAGPDVGTFLSIGGFEFSLTDVTVVFQMSTVILIEGTGVASGNGYDATEVDFYFSANEIGTLRNFSGGFTAQPVPVPGALILFGSALAGLGMRRK